MRRAALFALLIGASSSCRRATREAAKADEQAPPLPKHVEHPRLHPADPRVAQIESTSVGMCARREDGRVSCWLQYGVDIPVEQPRELALRDVVQLAGGWGRFCALHEDGTATCWGGEDRVRSDGTFWDPPKKVDGLHDAVEITAGMAHGCARLADGSVVCWGSGPWGELGNGKVGDERLQPPTRVAGLPSRTTQIAAGGMQTCALGEDGLVRCWGMDVARASPIFPAPPADAVPKVVPGISGVRAIWAHRDFDCARLADDSIRCWGQISLGSHLGRFSSTPETFSPFVGAKDLALKAFHACRLEDDDTVSCVGDNGDGQLANGFGDSEKPLPIKGLTHVRSIAVTRSVSCVLTEERRVFCWGGDTTTGGVGNGTPYGTFEPTAIDL